MRVVIRIITDRKQIINNPGDDADSKLRNERETILNYVNNY